VAAAGLRCATVKQDTKVVCLLSDSCGSGSVASVVLSRYQNMQQNKKDETKKQKQR